MKKNIIFISIMAAVVIGFGYFTLFSSPAADTASQLEKEQAELEKNSDRVVDSEVTKPKKGVDTLDNLRLMNEDLECTIVLDGNGDDTRVEGTYFVSKGSMRGDFLTDSPDLTGQVLTSMIVDKDTVYIWSEIEGDVYGIKMPLSDAEAKDSGSSEQVSINDKVQYDCKSWENVDGTVFVPPANVLFRDMSELFETGMEYGTVYEAELPY